jgi:hypothetical protein
MRCLRRYISPNGLGAHTRTDNNMAARYMTHKQRLCVLILPYARAIAQANSPTRFPLILRVEWPKGHQYQIL